MKKKTKYSSDPDDIAESIIHSKIIDDFIPPPEQLIFKEESDRITLSLSKYSISFFKRKSIELGIPYQRMIKRLVDIYARKYQIAER